MKKPRHVSMLGLEYGRASHPSRQPAALLPFPGSYPGFFVLAFGFWRAHWPIGLPSRNIGNQPAAVRATEIRRDIDAYLLPMPSAGAL